MKKVWIICALITAAACFTSCTGNVLDDDGIIDDSDNPGVDDNKTNDRVESVMKDYSQSRRLTGDDAKNITAAKLGAECDDIRFYRNYLCIEGGREYYDVECCLDGVDHSLEIDAYTGAILKGDTDA